MRIAMAFEAGRAVSGSLAGCGCAASKPTSSTRRALLCRASIGGQRRIGSTPNCSSASSSVEAACLTSPSASPVERLDAAEKQSQALARAAQILRPPLEKFYAFLSNDQKATLNDANPQPQNGSPQQVQNLSNDN
jgi:hypothetical protein